MKGKVEFFEDEKLKKPVLSTDDNGAKTLGIMPLCITTLSIMTLSIMTLSIKTLYIKVLYVILSISDIQHNTMPSR